MEWNEAPFKKWPNKLGILRVILLLSNWGYNPIFFPPNKKNTYGWEKIKKQREGHWDSLEILTQRTARALFGGLFFWPGGFWGALKLLPPKSPKFAGKNENFRESTARWFKVTSLSPSWRSPTACEVVTWTHHPKKVTSRIARWENVIGFLLEPSIREKLLGEV